MSWRRSLGLQLATYLVAALLLGAVIFVLGTQVANLLGIGRIASHLVDYSDEPTLAMVVASLARAPDGSAYILPNSALRARVEKIPTLQYAAFDPTTGAALPGSSTELGKMPISIDRVNLRAAYARFDIFSDDQVPTHCGLQLIDTSVGELVVAFCGNEFVWTDEPAFILSVVTGTFEWDLRIFCLAALVIWITVRRGLAPLRRAARCVRDIDMDSLEQRLSEGEMPSEVAPFVRAVNDALTRLSDGVERQRRFVANAAHELRTPIAILSARIDNPRDEDLRRDLRRYARNLRQIAERLLASARLAEGHATLDETLDFADLVLSVIADYTPLVMENRRHIEFEGPSTGITVRGDRRALQSVVTNLLDNALSAEPEQGTLLVRLGPGVTLEVIDHGEGVTQADREMIFEPFWRKSEATPGTGLGLAIVKGIVDLHGGRISVENTPGGGATFKVTLPEVSSN